MQAHAFMVADSAQAVEGKLYLLGGAWNLLRFPQYPATIPVGLAIAIDVDWNETNQKHAFEVRFVDADEGRLDPTIGGEFEVGRPPGAIPGTDQRVVLAVNAPLTITRPGSYAAVLYLAGEERSRTRFNAVQVSQQA